MTVDYYRSVSSTAALLSLIIALQVGQVTSLISEKDRCLRQLDKMLSKYFVKLKLWQ